MCAGASEMEKALLKTMFNDYNSKVRPALQSEDRVVVRVGMVLSSFVGLVRATTKRIKKKTLHYKQKCVFLY